MTELHAGLRLYRGQLRDAIARRLEQETSARPRRRHALRVGAPAAAGLAAAALAVIFTGGNAAQSADAAILHRVAVALTSPPGTILHERALVTAGGTTAPYELWIDNARGYRYHVQKWGHEGTGIDRGPYDPAAELRSLIASGNATVDGTATIDGAAAYKLTVSGSSDRFLNGTAYVSQSNYHPLLIETTGNGGERIVVQTYEYLPATPANLRLVGNATPTAASLARK